MFLKIPDLMPNLPINRVMNLAYIYYGDLFDNLRDMLIKFLSDFDLNKQINKIYYQNHSYKRSYMVFGYNIFMNLKMMFK